MHLLSADKAMSGDADSEERFIAAAIHSALTPREFEALVARLYEQQGYDTELKPEGADQGVDFLASKRFTTAAVQVKRYDPNRSTVGSPVVRETVGSAKTACAQHAHIVTSSLFTNPAEDAAERVTGMDVTLVDGVELVELLHEHGVAVEEADSPVIASATAGASSGAAFTDALLDEAERTPRDELEQALARYCRQQVAENQEEIEQKVAELGGYLVARAKDVEFRKRGRQVRTRLGERSGDVSDRLGSVREGAVERAGLVRDSSGRVKESAAETAGNAKDTAAEKAGSAKEKADETKDKAKDKASDLKDRFL